MLLNNTAGVETSSLPRRRIYRVAFGSARIGTVAVITPLLKAPYTMVSALLWEQGLIENPLPS